MRGYYPFLQATTALPLVFAAAGSVLLAPSATLAACDPAPPDSISCSGTTGNGNPLAKTIGTGPGDNGRSLNVAAGAVVTTTNRPAISFGDNATIIIEENAEVRGTINSSASSNGNFESGPNLIEFNNFGKLTIGEDAQLTKTGTHNRSEVINVQGYGNVIINHGTISASSSSAALWFEDTSTGTPRNIVDNYGVIARSPGTGGVRGAVFGPTPVPGSCSATRRMHRFWEI